MAKIVVVDDDIDLLELSERRLQRKGFIVLKAVNLAEARHHLKKDPEIQAIICDLFLSSSENGLDFYSQEIRNKLSVRFILVTGDAAADARIQEYKEHELLFSCLQKPYSIEDILKLMPKV